MKTKLLFTIFFLCILVSNAQNLIAYYPFNGNPNDESGNTINPTYIGAGVTLTTDRFGNANKAYNFDGATGSYIKMPADLLPTTNRTISLWFYVPDVTNKPGLLGYGGNGSCGTTLLMGLNLLGAEQFYVQGHCGNNASGYSYSSPPVNNWYHWVLTINGSSQKIYVNGQLKNTDNTFSGITAVSGKDFSLGVITSISGTAPYTDANVGYLNGKLDDVRIYDAAMSDAQVLQLYNLESTGLVAYYPFNGNANDASGNGHDGTINGNTTLTYDRFNVANRAFTFPNQSSNITIASTTSTNLENGFTLNAWVKYKNNNITSVIVCKHICGGPNGFFFGIDIDGQIQLWLANSSSTWSTVRTNTTFVENRWYMMTASYNAVTGIAKIYINGEISGSGNLAYNYYSSNPISIGESYQNNCGPGNLAGAIDEVKIYDRPLGETEIIQEYNLTQNSLVAYYPFNGNANDESGQNHNGTVTEAVLTTDINGAANKAYQFDGVNDKITAASQTDWSFGNGDFSITSLVNVSAFGTSRIVSAGYDANDGIWGLGFGNHYVWGSGLRINYFVYSGGAYRDFDSNEITGYSLGQWAFVGITKTGSVLTFYFNGQPAGTATIPYASNANSYLSIGSRQLTSGTNIEFFNGKIDAVRIYKRSLTSIEILQQYKNESTGLVAYYPFNGNANDESGNNNHGTLINNPSFALDRFGNPDKSISFDKNASQLVTVPDNPSLRIDNELTLSVFVKRKTLAGNHHLINKGGEYNSGSCNYDLSFSDASFVFKYNGNYHVGYVIHDMNWHHYAITTYHGSPDVKFYIDGVYSPTWINGGTVNLKPTTHSDLQIGGTIYYSDNIMDDVRIYNRILSPIEIASLYTNNDLKIENVENVATNNFYVINNTLYFKNTHNLNDIKTVEVYNLLGQKVFNTSKIKAEIFLNYLTKGVYILKVENYDGKISSLKFLME